MLWSSLIILLNLTPKATAENVGGHMATLFKVSVANYLGCFIS